MLVREVADRHGLAAANKMTRRLAAVCACAMVLVGGCGRAAASQPNGVSAKTLSQGTVDGKDYVLREITIAPGGSTGWHYHDGELHGWVVAGTLTHFDHSCAVDVTYQTGQSVTEPAGAGHVHIGRNLGSRPMVLDVVYVMPAGAPLSEAAPAPTCDHP
jgi:quercetin dioxygenase-like cupin family protein